MDFIESILSTAPCKFVWCSKARRRVNLKLVRDL